MSGWFRRDKEFWFLRITKKDHVPPLSFCFKRVSMGDVVKNMARERVWATGVNKNGLRGFFYGLYFSNGSPKLRFFFLPFM